MIDLAEELRPPDEVLVAPVDGLAAVRGRARRRRRRRRSVLLATCLALAVALVAGVRAGRHQATGPATTDRPVAQAVRNDSNSASWLGVGHDAAAGTPSITMVISDPVDITGDGTYTFVSGPLPDGVSLSPHGVSFPPDSMKTFRLGLTSPPSLVRRNGSTYVSATVQISDFRASYTGLRCWFQ